MNTVDYIRSAKSRGDIVDVLRSHGLSDASLAMLHFDLPPILYRYVRFDQFCMRNLFERTISATSPTLFNDVYDSRMQFDYQALYRSKIDDLNRSAESVGLSKVVAGDNDDLLMQQARERNTHGLSYLTRDFRITCFTTLSNDIRMWSHYGDNNKGMCIGYELGQSPIGQFVFPVVYLDKPIDVTALCESDDHLMASVLASIVTKARDWEDEREWRVVFYIGDHNTKRLPLHKIPQPAHIILGSNSLQHCASTTESQKLFHDFLAKVETKHIPLKLIVPRIGSFDLDLQEISPSEAGRLIRNRRSA
jgi:hypothetical protein